MKPKKRNPSFELARPARAVSSKDDITALIGGLAMKDAVGRQMARARLVSLGASAVPALIECLTDRRRLLRWEAAKALGDIADPAAAGVLLRSFDDKDTDVRWLAAMGLAALGLDGLRPLLFALQARPDSIWLREGAHHVCHKLGGRSLRFAALVHPLQTALDRAEPETAVPLAAYAVLAELQKPSRLGRGVPTGVRYRRT